MEKILVRSPDDLRGPARRLPPCYGMDLATGVLVEEGMAVGIIAAQSHRRAGHAADHAHLPHRRRGHPHVEESEIKAKKAGVVKFDSHERRQQRRRASTSC